MALIKPTGIAVAHFTWKCLLEKKKSNLVPWKLQVTLPENTYPKLFCKGWGVTSQKLHGTYYYKKISLIFPQIFSLVEKSGLAEGLLVIWANMGDGDCGYGRPWVSPYSYLLEYICLLQRFIFSISLRPRSDHDPLVSYQQLSKRICHLIFIGPESDHWLCLSVTLSLTDWLTDCCLVNLIDVTLVCEDANSKLVDVITVADVDDEDHVGNSLLQI